MERFAFIHGSSEGQSSFVPSGFPKQYSNFIEHVYFRGREPRNKQSQAEKVLIVELIQNDSHEYRCAYTFVKTKCMGTTGRQGQYFAITIFSEKYVYPEAVYNLLCTAYSQLFNTGRVLQKNHNDEDQYVINQFKEQDAILNDFLLAIEKAFMEKESTYGIGIKGTCANYDDWNGYKVVSGNCNSLDVFSKLCEVGRIYISDEYESSADQIKTLEHQVSQLQKQLSEKEEKINLEKTSEQTRTNQKIKELNAEINQLNSTITLLNSENEKYASTIDVVRNEVAKVERKVVNVREARNDMKKLSKKDILTISLLILNLILVALSSCLSYCFFRNYPPSPKEKQENVIGGNEQEQNEIRLNISPDTLSFSNASGKKTIEVTSTGGNWELPAQSDCEWLFLRKSDSSHLEITAFENFDENPRSYTFMIKCMDLEKQIVINQKGKPNIPPQPSVPISYTINVKDSKGNVLTDGSIVKQGETVTATVENPSFEVNIGWCFYGCSGNRGNVKENRITINGAKGEAVFSYGDTTNKNMRTKFKLKVEQTGKAESNNVANGNAPNVDVAPVNLQRYY